MTRRQQGSQWRWRLRLAGLLGLRAIPDEKISYQASPVPLQVYAPLQGAAEVTGGIHGACRLGSCAISEWLIFGRIAGRNAAAELPS